MSGERILLLGLGLLFAGMVAQCWRDEGISKQGRLEMCVKLSTTMEEYKQCMEPKPIEPPKPSP